MPSLPMTFPIYSFCFNSMSTISSMFRVLSCCAAMLLALPAAHAQGGAGSRPGGRGRAGQRLGQLENAKIAFITNRISLTQDQAQKFWPLYNEFSTQRRNR